MTRFFTLLVTLILSIGALAAPVELLVGDILLQPLNCRVCNLIEEEEGSPYSHIGIVIATRPTLVAEAWGNVVLTELKDFKTRTQKGSAIKVLRFQKKAILSDLARNQGKNMGTFIQDFFQRKYDQEFLWDNLDENKEEKFYCSELISKMILAFINLETPIKKMHFYQNRDAWSSYFKGKIPDQEWGNSPADFERSDLFFSPGEI